MNERSILDTRDVVLDLEDRRLSLWILNRMNTWGGPWIDSKQLETLMCRGLTEDDATNLIIEGLLSPDRRKS